MAEELSRFAAARRNRIGHRPALYSLRANDEARAHAQTFLKQYPDSSAAHDVFITVFRLDVREGRTADVEKRGRAIMPVRLPAPRWAIGRAPHA